MDLLLDMWESEGEFAGQVEYRSKLFKPETIRRWMDAFEKLAGQIAAHPDSQIYRFEFRSTEESRAEMPARSSRDAELLRRLSATKAQPIRAHS
jgi:hypothetical protein